MHKFSMAAIGFIIFFSPISMGWGTTYYVDATTGNDSSDGLSSSTAWRTIAKVNASIFNPGDQILFKRNEAWREQLNIPSSGAPDRAIVFSAYSDGNKPIFKASDLVTRWASTALYINVWQSVLPKEPKAVFLNGMEGTRRTSIQGLAQPGEWHWSSGQLSLYCTSDPATAYTNPGVECCVRDYSIYANSRHYITIDGIQTEHANDSNIMIASSTHTIVRNSVATHGNGNGIHLWTVSDGVILNNTIAQNKYSGIVADEGSQNIAISGNIIDKNGDAGVYTYYTVTKTYAVTNITIDNNRITNQGGYGISAGKAAGTVLIESNYLSGIGKKKIDSNGIGVLECPGSKTVRYNWVQDVENYHHEDTNDAIGIIADTGAHGTEIYYNVVRDCDGTGIAVYEAGGVKVYNNTIYNCGRSPAIISQASFSVVGTGSGNTVFKNNLVAKSAVRHAYVQSGGVGGFIANYNLYDDAQKTFHWSGSDYSLFDWKAITGQDINSPAPSDPVFADSLANDFALKRGSPAIDAGTSVGLSRDIKGKPVPWGNGVDLGAVEYRGIAPPRNMQSDPNP